MIHEIFSVSDIRQRVTKLAKELKKHPFTHVAVILNGSFHFASDLLRAMQRDVKVGFVQVASYEGTESKVLRMLRGPSPMLRGQDVLVIDDIADTGKTLQHVLGQIQEFHPTSLRTVVLVRRASCPFMPDHVGFTLNTTDFVLGYGLDVDGAYRNLPSIGVMR
jgi:hypoxanthine phosphoribosyltransferase